MPLVVAAPCVYVPAIGGEGLERLCCRRMRGGANEPVGEEADGAGGERLRHRATQAANHALLRRRKTVILPLLTHSRCVQEFMHPACRHSCCEHHWQQIPSCPPVTLSDQCSECLTLRCRRFSLHFRQCESEDARDLETVCGDGECARELSRQTRAPSGKGCLEGQFPGESGQRAAM